MSKRKAYQSISTLCITCRKTQASFVNLLTGKRTYCAQCSRLKGAQRSVSRYLWDHQYKDAFIPQKSNDSKALNASELNTATTYPAVPPVCPPNSNVTIAPHNTTMRATFNNEGWTQTSLFATSVATRLKSFADRELFGKMGLDDGTGWEPVFNDIDSRGQLAEGDQRRLQKPCESQDVKQFMYDLVSQLRGMLGLEPLSARQVFYMMRYEGCKQQPWHRDAMRGYFVIVPLCDGYENSLIERSHNIDNECNMVNELFIDTDDQKKTVTLNFGDIFIAHSRLVHAGGRSPMRNDDDGLTYRIPGCHIRTQGPGIATRRNDCVGMNRLSVHMYLEQQGTNVVLSKVQKNETILVNVKQDGKSSHKEP